MKPKKYWLRGLLIGFAVIIVGFVYMGIRIMLAYTGQCGGESFMLFLGFRPAHHCSFVEYLFSRGWFELSFTFEIYLWLLLLIIFIPTFLGLVLDRIKSH